MTDYLFRGDLAELDPGLQELLDLEAERQYRKLILIPSEKPAPQRCMVSFLGFPEHLCRRISR
jgi:hypothetical protein